MNRKLKGVIPKFKYLNILGKIDVRRSSALTLKFPEVTGRGFDGILPWNLINIGSRPKWNFYIYQGLTVWIASPKILRIIKQTGLNIKQIKREPKLSVLTLICNLNCPIHQSFVNSWVNLIFPFVCYLFNVGFFLKFVRLERFFWCVEIT